jgi:hypothetical protein
MPSATTFRNKAETCRSLMRYVRNEQTLRVLGEMIAENLAKAQEEERLALREERSSPPFQMRSPATTPTRRGVDGPARAGT